MLFMNQGVNNNRAVRPATGANVKKVAPAKKPVKLGGNHTENWVKIRSIRDGIITLPNKEMVTGVKIEPRNIFIMEDIQQDNIINA